MNSAQGQHLNEDQIIRAIVDPKDLPIFVREHLSACSQCRLEIERFEKDLLSLGELAQRLSPKPKNTIALPVAKETFSFLGSWKWKVSFGAAFSAVLVVAVLWWSGIMNTALNGNATNPSNELFEDEQLMTEIGQLSENALPKLYMDITGESDSEIDEDDFMEFIDPTDEDISLS